MKLTKSARGTRELQVQKESNTPKTPNLKSYFMHQEKLDINMHFWLYKRPDNSMELLSKIYSPR